MASLKDITTKIASGSTPTGGKDSYKEEGISLIRSLNIYDFKFHYKNLAFIDSKQSKKLSNVVVEENDILLNITGASVGRCTMVPKDVLPARVNQHVMIIRANNDFVDSNYLLYAINSIFYKSKLMSLSETGTTREALTKDDISTFKIDIPLLNIQTKIASILSSYDSLIENNNQRIKLLEEMAEEMYKEWFVRFRFPNFQNVKMLDGIPEGWENVKLKKYIQYQRGKSYSSEDLSKDIGLPFVNLKCVNRNGGFRRNGLKVFSGSYKDSNVVNSGDIVMAVTDMTQDRAIVGRVARIPEMQGDKYIFSMDLIKIEHKDIQRDFLYALLRFSGVGMSLKEFANGVNVLHLLPDMVYMQKSVIPPKELQIEFENFFSPILKEIDNLELKNDILKQTRDLLLPRLISGKLDVEALNIT